MAAAYDPDEQGDLGWYAVQEIPDLLPLSDRNLPICESWVGMSD